MNLVVVLGPLHPNLPDSPVVSILAESGKRSRKELLFAQVVDIAVDSSFPRFLASVVCDGIPDPTLRLQLVQVVRLLAARPFPEVLESVDHSEPLIPQ